MEHYLFLLDSVFFFLPHQITLYTTSEMRRTTTTTFDINED